MPWIATNLAGAMGDITAKANQAIADVQKSMGSLTNQISGMSNTLNSAVSSIGGSKDFLNKLGASGVYMIQLTPGKGAWNTRLSSAANNPPNAGFCFGTVNIIITPDLSGATEGFSKMKEAIAKPMQDAANFVNKLDSEDFIPEEEPEELGDLEIELPKSWDELFPVDTWSATSLGNIFGGATTGLADSIAKNMKATKSLLNTMNQASKVQHAVGKGLASVQAVMAGMNATGVYNIILEPGAGSYITRLQNEANAPPSDSNMYCSGFAAITVAPDLASMAEKYATMSKLLLGG